MNFIGLEIRQVFRTKRAPQQSKHGKEWKSVSAATTRVRMSSVSAATTRVRMSSPEDVPCRSTRDRPNTGQKKLRVLFFLWRAPQKMLRTYRSLEAYCATLWWIWSVFFSFFRVEWNWQGKTEVLGEKPVPLPLCPPQIPHGLTRDFFFPVPLFPFDPFCTFKSFRPSSCHLCSILVFIQQTQHRHPCPRRDSNPQSQ